MRAPRLVHRLSVLALLAAPLLAVPPAQAVSTSVLVAEVYGGGGNSGAPYRSDFIELANASAVPVDLDGWSVRYWSATGATFQSTPLGGSITPGGRYLVKEADGANSAATPLPAAAVEGSIALSASTGRVAVVDAAGSVVDLVGWGANAASFETAPAPGTTNTTSVARHALTDTDDNAADFGTGAPTPSNDGFVAPEIPTATVAEVQGAHHRSPLEGDLVADVEGVVTARAGNGFWLQSTTPDASEATSEGLFVFTSRSPAVAVGDRVSVDGRVAEFRPGGASTNLTGTQLTGATWEVLASGVALPAPVVLGEDRTAPAQRVKSGDPGDVERPDVPFSPGTDALDFYESLEGMRVGVRDAQVVGPTNRFQELWVLPTGSTAVRSGAGGVVYGGYDQPNTQRIQLDDNLFAEPMPAANVGDTVPGLVSGPLSYDFGNVELLPTSVPAVAAGGLVREVAPVQRDPDLSVASFNVENLAATNPQDTFDRLAGQVVDHLRSPDVIALEEIQDDNGAPGGECPEVADGVVSSQATVDRLVAAIETAGGPSYDARWVDPADCADGGQPGGNIRNVLLFRPDRGVEFVDRPGGDATTPVEVLTDKQGRPSLSSSPARIAPGDAAWEDSRKPLVGELRFRGQTVFVAAVHFASKGGDRPLMGRFQQPWRFSEEQRHAQARLVRGWVDDLLAADPSAKVVVAGDVNDFEFSVTTDILVDILEGSGSTSMTDLPRTQPAGERWTYVFDGNSQVLDHILVSPALATLDGELARPWRRGMGAPAFVHDIVHTNAAFHDQDSDHDPQVVHLNLKK